MDEAAEIGELGAQGAESPFRGRTYTATDGATAAGGFRLTGNKRGRAAASSEAIQGLREVAPPPLTDGSDDCCAICLHDLDADAKLRAMPCSHTIHENCIFEWLRRSATCPLCRHQLPTEEADEVPMRSSRVLYDEDHQRFTRIISGNGDPLRRREDRRAILMSRYRDVLERIRSRSDT